MTNINLVVFCPVEYKCVDRVLRKIKSLTRNGLLCSLNIIGGSGVVREGVLSKFSSTIKIYFDRDIDGYTHVIIFGDSHSVIPMIKNIESRNIRYVYTPITRVVNVKRLPENFNSKLMVYIGRGTPFGNPYPVQETGSKDKSIHFYHYDFERGLLGDGDTKTIAIKDLLGRYLGCSCKPFQCHGDVLADYLNSIDIDEIDSELKKQCWFYKFGFASCWRPNIGE